jgi:hypothetical protein
LDDPTADAVIERYIGDADSEEVRQVAAEIDALLRIEMTEDERRTLFDDLDCSYYPAGDELTYSAWLRRVHNMLTAKR